MKQLQVGDKVYRRNHDRLYPDVIVRVTKTQAITSGGTKLKRNYHDRILNKVGASPWSMESWYIADESLDKECERDKKVIAIDNWMRHHVRFSPEKIDAIYDFLYELFKP